MITLLTRPPSIFSIENIKDRVKTFLGKKGGPYAVKQSLIRGFNELNISYILNPKKMNSDNSEFVHVIYGTETLRWAIDQKKLGRIKTLIAGPTIVVSPLDCNKILTSPEIDLILCPSDWVKNYYESKIPDQKNKIKVWFAGVEIPSEYNQRDNINRSCLIYLKNFDYKGLENIHKICDKLKVKIDTIIYGKFKKEEYFKKLINCDFMIHIGKSESQSLALCEAWVRNIATLVLNTEKWQYNGDSWEDPLISAPYLDDSTGRFFKESDSLEKVIFDFLNDLDNFKPREKSLSMFTDKKTTAEYLNIIQNI